MSGWCSLAVNGLHGVGLEYLDGLGGVLSLYQIWGGDGSKIRFWPDALCGEKALKVI